VAPQLEQLTFIFSSNASSSGIKLAKLEFLQHHKIISQVFKKVLKKEEKIQAWQVWLHLHNKSAVLMNKAPTNNQIQQARV
jgi:hypothetical protein